MSVQPLPSLLGRSFYPCITVSNTLLSSCMRRFLFFTYTFYWISDIHLRTSLVTAWSLGRNHYPVHSSCPSQSSGTFSKQPLSFTASRRPSPTYSTRFMMSPISPTSVADLTPSLYLETPLVKSTPLSQLCGKDVYLKLDLLQESGSFKDRGMARLCQSLAREKGVQQFISSSGGNAGLAVATVARKLHIPVHVIVPQTTKTIVMEKLKRLGAQVTVHGENWNAADELARQWVQQQGPTAAYISPYDHPLLWEGHSTIMQEIQQQLHTNGSKTPLGAIIVSVGGGGLLCGVLEGATQCHMESTTVIAAETQGASSFGQSWKEQKLVRLNAIESVATSLGALQVTEQALLRAQAHPGGVEAVQCTDREAVEACLRLAQDHRLLVEPACGAALAVLYSARLREAVLSKMEGPIVVEVCGGSGVSLELLNQWKEQFEL